MNETERNFHLEEYRQLRAEVTALITKTESLLQYTVVVAAAVFTWVTVQSLGQQPGTGVSCSKWPGKSSLTWLPWIPTLVTVVVGFLGGSRFLRVKEMGAYLKTLEDALGNSRLGWEKYLSSRPATVAITTIIAWGLLLVGTAFVGWQMPSIITSFPPCGSLSNNIIPSTSPGPTGSSVP